VTEREGEASSAGDTERRSPPARSWNDGAGAPSRLRIAVFRVLAALSGLFFLVTVRAAISPWAPPIISNPEKVHDPDAHRWSDALAGGPDLAGAMILLYLAWRPLGTPLLLQWLAIEVVVFLIANVPFVGPPVALIAVPIVLTIVAYPQPSRLLEPPWQGRLRLPLLVLAVIVALPLFILAGQALLSQLQGMDEIARNYDSASNLEHLLNVAAGALLAATGRPGSRFLAVVIGGVLVFLGIAAISVAEQSPELGHRGRCSGHPGRSGVHSAGLASD
jgi:hypothetical protein